STPGSRLESLSGPATANGTSKSLGATVSAPNIAYVNPSEGRSPLRAQSVESERRNVRWSESSTLDNGVPVSPAWYSDRSDDAGQVPMRPAIIQKVMLQALTKLSPETLSRFVADDFTPELLLSLLSHPSLRVRVSLLQCLDVCL